MKNLNQMIIEPEISIFDTLKIINDTQNSAVFVVNSKKKLIGLAADGDIRRAILKGIDINQPIRLIMNSKPIFAKPGISDYEILNLMLKKSVYIIPILNQLNEVIDFYHIKDFLKDRSIYKPQIEKTNELEKNTILIIGGAGYIGSNLCHYLINSGFRIKVLDNLGFSDDSIKDLYENENFHFIKGDFTDISTLMDVLPGVSHVIHFAAIVGDPAGDVDPDKTHSVNLYGVKVLAELCKNFSVSKFIFVSTCSVYGFFKDTLLDEKSSLNPISLYAKTKMKAEKLVLQLESKDFHPIVIRLATVFGLSYRMRFDLVINLLVAKAIREKRITIFSGDQWRPFVHVKDVARAIDLILQKENKLVSGEIFNVGNERLNKKINDLSPIYKKIFPEIEVVINTDKEDNRSYKVSFEKIRNKLEFDTKYSIEDGIHEIGEFLKENPTLNYQDPKYSNIKNFKYGTLKSIGIE
jgi:nucleoside-diphosphate-sugar epimerase